RMDVGGRAAPPRPLLDPQLYRARSQSRSTLTDEQGRLVGVRPFAAHVPPAGQRLSRAAAYRYHAILLALAFLDSQHAVGVERIQVERDQIGQTQTRRIEQFH